MSKDVNVSEIMGILRRLLMSPKDSNLRKSVIAEIIASVDRIAEEAATVTGMLAQSAVANGARMPMCSFFGAAGEIPSISPRAAIEESLQAIRTVLSRGDEKDPAQIFSLVQSARKLQARLENL